MNKYIWVTVLLILGVGLTAGPWWAYQEGYFGKNPKAPTLDNFKQVAAAWAFRKGELRSKCIAASPDSAPGSRRGRPGWSTTDTMGLGVTTFTLRTPDSSQQLMRDKTLLRFDHLAQEGFFDVRETEMQLETGETVPAREFVLTQKGWENSSSHCFYAGRPEVLEVVSFARVQPEPDGLRTYEITYKVGVRELPLWAASEQARDILGDLANHKTPEEKRLRLVRSEKGWLPEPLVRTKEGVLDHSRLNRTLDELLPMITPAEILELGKEHDFLRNPNACLLVPRTVGADADRIEWSLSGPVSITMLEADAMTNPVPRVRESWSARMASLVRAGVFFAENIPRDEMRNRPPGVKYTLDKQFLPIISKSGPGCLRISPLKVDILASSIEVQGRQDGTLSYNFKAVGKVADKSWVHGINWSGLPEVEAYLNYGVPISGSVELVAGKWRLLYAGAASPVIVEPPRIQTPLMNSTAQMPDSAAGIAHPAVGETKVPTQPGSVHVISVYQAMGAGGNHAEGTIRIGVGAKGRAITLVLSAYEPVHWIVQPDPGAEIARVVVMGNYPGRASGISQDRVQRVNGFLQDYKSDGGRGRRGYSSTSTAETVERLVGRRPESVDGAYEAHFFSIGSIQIPPPPPVSPPAWGGSSLSRPMGIQQRAMGNAIVIPMPEPKEVVIMPGAAAEPGR